MDAVKFLEEKDRMCRFYETCSKCPCFYKSGIAVNCILANGLSLAKNKEQVAIVEKWSAEHPRKTRQSVFLEQYPEAKVDKSTGVLVLCPAALKKEYRDDRGACNAYCIESNAYCIESGICADCRRKFWMQEVE